MGRYISIGCLGIFCLIACRSSKAAPADFELLFYRREVLIAWNEDTVNTNQIALYNGKKFAYTTIRKDSPQKIEKYYKGTFRFSGDTIYVAYDKGLQPEGLTDYLSLKAPGIT